MRRPSDKQNVRTTARLACLLFSAIFAACAGNVTTTVTGDGGSPDAGAPDSGFDAGSAGPTDDAEILSASLPSTLNCGETRNVTVTVKNKGTAVWADPTYRLGAVGESDPLSASTRVTLATGASVLASGTHDFNFALVAPGNGGSFTTDWQMVHEGVAWFGGIASQVVTVTCPAPDGETVLASATVYNSPADVATWPITSPLTRLVLGSGGVEADFSKKEDPNRWPDVTPPGWTGPLQYTLWLAMKINGAWYTSGIIQFWYGLAESGGDVTQNDQIAINWVYDGRWGPMAGHQPIPGEYVGFMVTSGNERGVTDTSQATVIERSNMVIIAFPAASDTVFTF